MVDVSKPINDMSDHLLKGMHLFNPVTHFINGSESALAVKILSRNTLSI